MEPGESVRDVLDRLSSVEADFVGLDVDRKAAQLKDGHFHRVARPQTGLFEHERHALTRQHLWR